MKELADLIRSFEYHKEKTFVFSIEDTESLKFLFDEREKKSIAHLTTNMETYAIDGLMSLIVDAFIYHKSNFEKIQINSGYRTPEEQAEIMLELKDLSKYDATRYFIEYLRLVEKGNKNDYEAYYKTYDSKGEFTNRIGDNNPQLIVDVQTKGILSVLTQYIENKDYEPSHHPYKRAYDIKKNTSTPYLFNKHKGGKSDKYRTHIHLSFIS
ncbi:MAG: hypothetical protein ACRC0X_06330 [Brevinema sp.]